MSQQTVPPTESQDRPLVEDLGTEAGSLAERMANRRQAVEQNYTEWFPVAGWEDMLEVELRMLGWKIIRQIGDRHKKIRDPSTRELYIACDQIMTATEGFREVPEGGGDPTPVNRTWEQLARDGVKNLPEGGSQRQNFLALIGRDTLVMRMWGDYQEWMQEVRPQSDQEVAEDFG